MAAARILPLGANAMAFTSAWLSGSLRDFFSAPSATFQSLIEWSRLPVARDCPSGEKASDWTPSWWPVRVNFSVPASASQTLTAPSSIPAATSLPSGLTATASTASGRSLKLCFASRDSRSQTRTLLSSDPEATRLPSGNLATPVTAFAWPFKGSRTLAFAGPSPGAAVATRSPNNATAMARAGRDRIGRSSEGRDSSGFNPN